MSLSVKGFKYRTIGTTNALLCPEPIHPPTFASRRGGGLLGKNDKTTVHLSDKWTLVRVCNLVQLVWQCTCSFDYRCTVAYGT